jgi:hypothetical protein
MMGKYQPLSDFLKNQAKDEIRLSFAQIERIIGQKLPPKAQHHRAWWSNSASNNVMTKAWLDAGFRSEQVDLEDRKLVFRRLRAGRHAAGTSQGKRPAVSKRHPLFGAMKGLITIAPGVDLTEPAMPEWGEVAYGDKSWDDFK